MKYRILSDALANIPWEDKAANCDESIWRSNRNPIITAKAVKGANSIFNSAVVPYKDGFAGVFRCDNKCREMRIHAGFSHDGINWEINEKPINFICQIDQVKEFDYAYDPRVVFIEDRYYLTWCNGFHGPTIGLAYTYDFKEFYQMENAFLPFNRNGVLFPEKINGKYIMISRPSDTGHTPFGDIFLSQSPDMKFWGMHRYVMGTRGWWESLKIGGGPVPIKTSEGWLLIYHGVLNSCNGYVYHFGAALLDLDRPWQVIKRAKPYLLAPRELYERVGDVNNVVFPTAALTDGATGRIAIYYGAADSVTALAYTTVDDIIDFIKENHE